MDKNGARKRQYLITHSLKTNLKDSDVTKGTTDWNGIKICIAKKKWLVSFLLFALLPPCARPRMENRHDPLPPRPAVTFLQLRPAVSAVRASDSVRLTPWGAAQSFCAMAAAVARPERMAASSVGPAGRGRSAVLDPPVRTVACVVTTLNNLNARKDRSEYPERTETPLNQPV